MQPDSRLIEQRFQDGIQRWVEHGIDAGGFMTAVLENNLSEAIARADSNALDNLPHIVAFLYNRVPSTCWGSPELVAAWRIRFVKKFNDEGLKAHA